ncbi:hypothetical protein NDU88_005200 [Pleurodeles waltl]|uniref:Uncharacterized protein n=1 Tax=Pleurodeles waltl TaxID=8319 RepID=A0AAV7PG82_PLEWA|nr:hypothetical protein NDU88_005200 [Pleurodeles waltl]
MSSRWPPGVRAKPRLWGPGLQARPRGGPTAQRKAVEVAGADCLDRGVPWVPPPGSRCVLRRGGGTPPAAKKRRPAPRAKRSRTRRDRKRNEAHTGPTKCTPDMEQLIQEGRQAIHTAATISASPLLSGSDKELSQPASDHPLTPDGLNSIQCQETMHYGNCPTGGTYRNLACEMNRQRT